MKNKDLFKKIVFIAIIVLLLASLLAPAIFSQAPQLKNPREEKLLNGLKVLMWSQPGAEKIRLTLRIHSGSAFDPQGKEGVMRLLSEAIFPNVETRDFFIEDLEGGLEVTSNYDFIQIDASAKPSEMLTMLETVAQAVTNVNIDKELTAKLKAAQLARVKEAAVDPVYVADQAVAKALFGTFPYGRPAMGTPESLEKIDFADLIDARQRFLTADNATLAVSGNINYSLAQRAVRRYFGSWLKSDRLVPPTFRQPDPPSAALSLINSPVPGKSEFRFALRGVARDDKVFHSAMILERVLASRIQSREGAKSYVRQETRILPGAFVFGVSDWRLGGIKKEGDAVTVPVVDGYQMNFLKAPISAEEFTRARNGYLSDLGKSDPVRLWLDADTYKLPQLKSDLDAAHSVTLADVQRLLESLQKQPVAYVLLFGPDAQAEQRPN